MFNRKELSERAVKVLKAHYGIFLIVCLIAAFIGSEFTETFSLLRMPVSVYKNIADNADDKEAIEEQGVTFVTSDIDNRTKSAMLNALISVFMNNEEQGKINSENIIENAKANAGEILGRTSGILSSVVNSFSSGAVVFMIVDIIYGITGSRHVVVILLLILSLFVYFVIRYMIKMSYIVISRRIFLESRTYKKVGVGKFMFLMRIKRLMHVAWVLFVKDVFTILWSLTIAGAFIKPFSYQLVPYIIAENPDLSATEAITLSRNMMNGYKWKSFCYNISFIGWSVLCFLTFGLVGVFFANPYRTAFFTEMYVEIRKLAKTENIKDIDKLNDIYLYEMASENELKIAYADIYEYMNQEDPEERFIDDISKSDIKYFIKLRKVLADWFGVILINSKEEKRFEDDKAEQIKADRCKQEILREVYPSRLFTLKEHRANFESTVYMRNYSIPSLILIIKSPFLTFFSTISISTLSNTPKGKELEFMTSTSSFLFIKLSTAPTFINLTFPLYKSIFCISKVANFSSSSNLIPIIEFIVFIAITSSNPSSINFSIISIAILLSVPAPLPEPIPSDIAII